MTAAKGRGQDVFGTLYDRDLPLRNYLRTREVGSVGRLGRFRTPTIPPSFQRKKERGGG